MAIIDELREEIVVGGVRFPLAEEKGRKLWSEGESIDLQDGGAGIPVSAEWPVGCPGGMGETKRTSRDSIGCAFATLDSSNYGFLRLPPSPVTVTPTTAPVDLPTFGFEDAAVGTAAATVGQFPLEANSSATTATAHTRRLLTSDSQGAGTAAGVTQALLTSFGSTTVATSYATTNSIQPTGNKLVLAAVASEVGTLPTLSGGAMTTWTQVVTKTVGPSSSTAGRTFRVTVFRSLQATPGAAAVLTADFGGVSQNACKIIVSEFGNVVTSGANGADAVVQSAFASVNSATSLTVALSAFGATANATFAAFHAWQISSGSISPGSGLTEIADKSGFSGNLQTEWSSSENVAQATYTANITWAGVALEIQASSSTTSSASFDTASIAPTKNCLILAAVYNSLAAGATTPTMTGNGLTWVSEETQTFSGGARRLTIFRALKTTTPTVGSATIAFGGTAQDSCRWSIVEFANVDTSGTNGSGAVIQSETATSAGATSLTVTLAALGAGAATYGAFAIDGTGGITPGSGFTELHEVINLGTLQTEWRNDADTSVDATETDAATVAWRGIAIEIKVTSPIGSYVTGSFTPTANRLILASVYNNRGATPPETPTLSGCNLTWTQEDTVTSGNFRLTTFRAMGSAPVAGTLTIDFGGTAQTAVRWAISEFSNVNTGGTDGSGAVIQSVGASGTSTAPLTTLSAFAATTNATYGAIGVANTSVTAPGSGFTEIHDVSGTSAQLETEWKTTSDTTVDGTVTSAAWLIMGIEIQAGTVPAGTAGTSHVYIQAGQYSWKCSVTAGVITVEEIKDFGDGATAGKSAKFGTDTYTARWFVPTGLLNTFWRLDSVASSGADTWSQDSSLYAHAFAVTNQGANAALVRGHSTYKVDISTDGTTFADDFSVGDSSTRITAMEDSGTALFVAKEDNLYEFDTSGTARQLTRYQKGDKATTYGTGMMVPSGSSVCFYNHKALHFWDGDRARMVGIDANPLNRSIPNIDHEPHRGTHQETVYASDEWIYSAYKVVETTTKTYIFPYQRSGQGWIAHGFMRFDGAAHLALVDSSKRLWFTDIASAQIGYVQLGADGSPDAGRDNVGYGAINSTYGIVYPREDFGFPHTLKELRSFEVKTWSLGTIGATATMTLTPFVYRDGGAQEEFGLDFSSGIVNKTYWASFPYTDNPANIGPLTADATTITYTGTGDLSTGDIVVIGQERMIITAIDTSSNILTVVRGFHGTSAVEHRDADEIRKIISTCYDVQLELQLATTADYATATELRILSARIHALLRPDGARRIMFSVDTKKQLESGDLDPPKTQRDFLHRLERGAPVSFIDPYSNTGSLFVTKVNSVLLGEEHWRIDIEAITWVTTDPYSLAGGGSESGGGGE